MLAFAAQRRINLIRSYQGRTPRIADSAYIDPQSIIIGDVTIAADSSVWPGTVIRGDVHYIRIGSRTNVQDGCVLHVMRDTHPLILGDNVTIGHGVVLHPCAPPGIGPADEHRRRPVHLTGEHQCTEAHAECIRCPLAVHHDVGRVVPHVQAEVQRVVRRVRHAACPCRHRDIGT